MNDEKQDRILTAAIAEHNLRYGTGHCDSKYILSCSELPNIILSLPREDVDPGRNEGEL